MTNRCGDLLSQMEDRSKEADRLITLLKNQIGELKGATTVTASSNLKALNHENEELKAELENWKSKLILAEIHNGTKQIPTPTIKKPIPNVQSTTSDPKVEVEKIECGKKSEKTSGPSEKPVKEKAKKAESGDGPLPVDVSRLDFRIGKIIAVKKHPDADSLYIEEVDVGDENTRTVVSGLVNFIPIEEMHNRTAVFLCNMKPMKMRGVALAAMIMCASTPEKVEILTPPHNFIPGEVITFEGYKRKPDTQLNPKKKVFETCAPDLRVNENKVATYKGVPFVVPGKGQVVSKSLINTIIK